MVLSVCVLTYNHERYIAAALDSVLMQQTDFPFEILVGEDCSEDRTAEIVREYQRMHPDQIRVFCADQNTGGRGPTEQIRCAAKGEYLAWLEGDDLWTDPLKLQKQVDFLRRKPEYIGCSHEVMILDGKGNIIPEFPYKRFSPQRRYTLKEAAANFLPGHGGCALVYRNIFLNLDHRYYEAFKSCKSIGDMKIALFLSLFGPLYRLPDCMGIYRYNSKSGESYSARTAKTNMSLNYLEWAMERKKLAEFVKEKPVSFYKTFRDICYHACVTWLKRPTKINYQILSKVFSNSERPVCAALYCLRQVCMYPARKIVRTVSKR